MAQTIDDTRPDIAERYHTATNASNLRVEADRGGSADILIAAGMVGVKPLSGSAHPVAMDMARLGMALMRLHTEFDRTSIPQGKATETDYRLLMAQLKSLPAVREQVTLKATALLIERPERVAVTVIAWWLHKICRACRGRKYETIAGSPSLSAKPCKCCRGTGETPLPYGYEGKLLERFLDESVERATAQIKIRLGNMK